MEILYYQLAEKYKPSYSSLCVKQMIKDAERYMYISRIKNLLDDRELEKPEENKNEE